MKDAFVELSPQMKKWEPLIGKWSYEVEERESPTADWKKGSWSAEFRSGGFFVEIRGTGDLGGQKVSWIEIRGYDPVQRGYISTFFFSNGSRGDVTSMDWSGTTLTTNFNFVTAERETQTWRHTMEHSPDFKSSTGTYEMFTDGNWWTVLKVKGTKVE
jgi:hypothetical protein